MNFFRSKANSNASQKDPKFGSEEKTSEAMDRTSEPVLSPPGNPVVSASTLNAEQEKKVGELREFADSIKLPESDEYYPNENGFLTDGTLKRYLRARKWDVEAAKTMLKNTILWRREEHPDCLDPAYIRPEAETGKMYYNGFDKCHRPVWIMRPGRNKSKDQERQVKHIVYSLERGIRLMPKEVDNIAIIVDFTDSSAAQNPSIATCKKFLDILGNHYPERLGVAFVVHSPWFFFATFRVISPFMDPVTKAKIKFVYDNKEKKDEKETSNEWVHITDYIDENQLEDDFGGNIHFQFDVKTYWDSLLEKTGNPFKLIEYH